MAQHGVYANRNVGHKERRAREHALAPDDKARLAVAFDWFRSSTALLTRRRPPDGIDKEVHRATAARLVREATAYLKTLAEAIDRGDYDAQRK